MTVVVAILGLIFLIIVHELGHMLTAKALGVRVPEFGVGFGPPLFKKKIGETVYSLRIVLLGGFAKMAGMNDGAEGPDTFPAKSAWRRALIIFAGPLANILTAVAILAIVLMTTGAVTGVKPEVRQIQPNSMAERVGIQPGDRFVAVDGTRIKGWDSFEDEVQEHHPGEEISVTVVRDGEERTYTGKLGADPNKPDAALVGVRPEVETTTYGPFEADGGRSGGEDYGSARRLRGRPRHRRTKLLQQRHGTGGYSVGREHERGAGVLPPTLSPDQPEPRPFQPAASPATRRRTPVLYRGGEGPRSSGAPGDDGQDRGFWDSARPHAVPVRNLRRS
jgi:membrane-associated protease RseP (regulator of RpoE activity)